MKDDFEAPMCVADVMRLAGLPPLERRMILMHVLGMTHVQLITHDDRVLSNEEISRVKQLFLQRKLGEPMAYLMGEREFYGRAFAVNANVLIPRPETELLVDLALEKLPQGAFVIDMGTGSGAIAVSLAATRDDLHVFASDISAPALAVARQNAQRLSSNQVTFFKSNWFDAFDADWRFDMICSNPPYIACDDVHLSKGDLRFEPRSALTDEHDGLDAYRILISGARVYLKPGGWLLVEHGYDQANAVRGMFVQQGFIQVACVKDFAGIERVTMGRLPHIA